MLYAVPGHQQDMNYSVMTPAGPVSPSAQASASVLTLKNSSMQQVHCPDKSVVNMTMEISSDCHAVPLL